MFGASTARAQPISPISRNIVSRPSQPCSVPTASSAASTATVPWQIATISLRSPRSASQPAGRVSTSTGMNCTSPTRPRSSARPVSA